MNALAALLLLLELLSQVALVGARYRALIERARAEGRDLTDAELDELKSERKAAIERWREAP